MILRRAWFTRAEVEPVVSTLRCSVNIKNALMTSYSSETEIPAVMHEHSLSQTLLFNTFSNEEQNRKLTVASFRL